VRIQSICILFLTASGLGLAQEFRSSISGLVLDPQGASVPNTKVSATQNETGAKSSTLSSADGHYTLPLLRPGTYTISAEAPGFKRYLQQGFAVGTNERLQLDVKLELGGTTDTVTVNAEGSLLETASASTGQSIGTKTIEDMPMNGRTALVLAQLSYGVMPASNPLFNRPFDNAGPSGFSMGGGPNQKNELLLDGAPDTTNDLRVAYNPPVDAVQELKVEVFNTDAAYGHTGGGTVNTVLKGGTNTLHGTLYEFNQTSALDANPWSLNAAGQTQPASRYNQYGANAGAPVYIPRLFNGKNKVFWFFAYEGIKDSFPEPSIITVPTAAERGGDFSALLPLGGIYTVYNPYSGVKQGARVARTPFPGNIIPSSMLNPLSKAYLSYLPLPNLPGLANGENNYASPSVRSDTFDSELGRLDFNLSDRNKLFWDFRHNGRVEDRGNLFRTIATGNFLTRINWGTTLDDVYTLTPTLVLDTRLNWTRFDEGNTKPSYGFNPTNLGFPSYLDQYSEQLLMPAVSISGYQGVGSGAGNWTPNDNYQLFTTATKVLGNHTLKVGVDAREYRLSNVSFGNSSGSFSFGNNWTVGPLDNSPGAPLGQAAAAFMMGLPTGGSFDINGASTAAEKYISGFVQDDWRVRPNLTLNLGVRYEQDFSTTERFDRTVNGFAFGSANPIQAQAQALYAQNPIPQISVGQFKTPGGLLFASTGNPNIYTPQSHFFSPRFGFAWSPWGTGSKTVVRGGFGIFVTPLGINGVIQPGFSQSTPFLPTLDGYLTVNSTLSNPFPTGFIQPSGSSLGPSTYLGQGVSFFNPNPLNPYSMRWDLDIEREFGRNIVFEIGYEGNHSIHLPDNQNLDYVPGQYLSQLPFRDNATINLLSANVPSPFHNLIPGVGISGSTVHVSQLLLPYPQFTGVTEDGVNDFSSYFDMLSMRVEKRFSNGLQLLANYSYSRLMSYSTRLNAEDPSPENFVDGIDHPHRVVISGRYELPFGKGKRFATGTGPIVNRLVGGWIANFIYTYETGSPLGWGNVIYLGGPLNIDPHNPDHTFSTTPFDRNPSDQLSDNLRTLPPRFSNLRSDSTNNVDFSVIKDIPIRDRLTLEFRAEFFNFFNHPLFNGANLSPTSPSFGTIPNGPANLPRSTQLALRLAW
jgi:carboxypeptidase family protein